MFEAITSFIVALVAAALINWLLSKNLKEAEYVKVCLLFIALAVLLPFVFFGANCRLVNIGLVLSVFQLNGLISLIALVWVLLRRTKHAFVTRCLMFGIGVGILIVMIPALSVLQFIVFC